MTVLWKSRDLTNYPTVDLEVIEREPLDNNKIDVISNEITEDWSKLGFKTDSVEYWGEEGTTVTPRWSSKQGPNGPASETSVLEEISRSDEHETLIKEILSKVAPFRQEMYSDDTKSLLRNTKIETKKNIIMRRLSAIADYEGKTRVIAIGDWMTQTVLRPVHDRLMSMLKRLSTDMTHKQESIPSRISEYWKIKDEDCRPSSIDLTSATDCLPVNITCSVLNMIWKDESLVKSWKEIMIGFKFVTPFEKGKPRREVSYGTGQPMGFYSSWAAFSVTNHVLVRLAAKRVGLFNFDRYLMIGDDIVIFSQKVSREYERIMFDLGVSTKPQDSIYPKSTHSLEIAKRLFRAGNEVSPLWWRLKKANQGLFYLHVIKRGIDPSLVSLTPGVLWPLVSAILLNVWDLLEPWAEKSVHGAGNTKYTRVEDLFEAPDDDIVNHVGKLRIEFRTTIIKLHSIFMTWYVTESGKITRKDMDRIKGLTPQKISRKVLTSLSKKAGLTITPNLKSAVRHWCSEELLNVAIFNTCARTHGRSDNWHSFQSESAVIDIVEANPSYKETLNEMRNWIVVDSNDVLLDNVEAIDNQMIMGVEKACRGLNYTNDQGAALLKEVLTLYHSLAVPKEIGHSDL
jgi:hypothetical protein